MPETAAIEAVRAAQGSLKLDEIPKASMDVVAVETFHKAMSAGPSIPFVDQIGATWKATQIRSQEHVRRISKLSELSAREPLTVGQLTALQYEMQTAGFELEVTTIVAKKATDMVSTLVKNG